MPPFETLGCGVAVHLRTRTVFHPHLRIDNGQKRNVYRTYTKYVIRCAAQNLLGPDTIDVDKSIKIDHRTARICYLLTCMPGNAQGFFQQIHGNCRNRRFWCTRRRARAPKSSRLVRNPLPLPAAAWSQQPSRSRKMLLSRISRKWRDENHRACNGNWTGRRACSFTCRRAEPLSTRTGWRRKYHIDIGRGHGYISYDKEEKHAIDGNPP